MPAGPGAAGFSSLALAASAGVGAAGRYRRGGLASHAALRRGLVRWLHSARAAGLEEESILALFLATFQNTQTEKEDTA